jgi:uncharacterized protein YjiK
MKKHPIFIIFGIVLFAVLVVVSIYLFKRDVSLGYDFNEPDEVMVLPDTLHEISGITLGDDNNLFCVQDENGILFQFNTQNKELVGEEVFGKDGDYEGICKVGSVLYVLRSDGVLFELSEQSLEIVTEEDVPENDGLQVRKHRLKLPVSENEGLCYDEQNNRLLIISREQSPHTKTNDRLVYAFDLLKKRVSKKPVFSLNPFTEKKNNRSDLLFRPSELAIHPVTGELFVISSKDHALFVFSPKGKIKKIYLLNPLIFNKPEGLAFLANGDLYISNEGKHEKPTLLFFQYKRSGKKNE